MAMDSLCIRSKKKKPLSLERQRKTQPLVFVLYCYTFQHERTPPPPLLPPHLLISGLLMVVVYSGV